MTDNGSSRNFYHSVSFATYYYIDVAQYGSYQFNLNVNGNGYLLTAEDFSTASVEVFTEQGDHEFARSFQSNAELSGIFNVTLCKGIHLIRVGFANTFSYTTTQQISLVSTSYIFKFTTNAAGINYKNLSKANSCIYTKPGAATDAMLNPTFSIPANKKMLLSAWVREQCTDCAETGYTSNQISIQFNGNNTDSVMKPSGPVIEGWQRYEGVFTAPANASQVTLNLINTSDKMIYFDDIRIHPFNANMKSYIYDPVNLRLAAELDANNYATYYDYDEEGGLIRTKVETREGIKTIKETRGFQQRKITSLQ
jgi:hypothetical protein